MGNKKTIINLISSIISLCLAIVLSIVIVLAWFGNNNVASAGVTVNVISGSEIKVTLEGYDDSTRSWIDVTNVNFDNISPGDKYFLRLKVVSSSNSDKSITASYGEYKSEMSELINVDIDQTSVTSIKGHISYLGVDIMDIEENIDNKTSQSYPYIVKMDGEIIYYIDSNGKITIAPNYMIHNAMVSYNLGSSKDNLTPNQISFEGASESDLESGIFGSGVTVYAKSTTYCYFALEYVDYESTSSQEKKYDSNNYFVYQTFKVKEIKVFGA